MKKAWIIKLWLFSLLLLSIMATPLFAQSLESDWLEPIVGSQGDQLGAEVIDVTKSPEKTIIELSIPLRPSGDFDPSVAIKKPRGDKTIVIIRNPEVISSEDPETMGLRFKVQGISNFHFKIQLMDSDSDTRGKTP